MAEFVLNSKVDPSWFQCTNIGRATHPLLSSASHKVRWAEVHLEALMVSTLDYLGAPGRLPVLQADLDVVSGYHVFRIESMPDYFELIANTALRIGDVVGNLRPALDHAIWSIVTSRVGSDDRFRPRDVAFPVSESGGLMRNRAAKAIQPYLSKEEWQVVTLALLDNPYPGSDGVYGTWGRWLSGHDHPLRMLQKLSNDDKHRLLPTVLLLPTVMVFQNLGPQAQRLELLYGNSEAVSVPDVYQAPYGTPAAPGIEVYRVRFANSPPPHISNAGQVNPQLAFQDASQVIQTLDRITCFIKHLLREFERVLPSPFADSPEMQIERA